MLVSGRVRIGTLKSNVPNVPCSIVHLVNLSLRKPPHEKKESNAFCLEKNMFETNNPKSKKSWYEYQCINQHRPTGIF